MIILGGVVTITDLELELSGGWLWVLTRCWYPGVEIPFLYYFCGYIGGT